MNGDLTPIPCPYCGANNDGHYELDGTNVPPGDGDVSYCVGCKEFSIFCVHEDSGYVHLFAPRTDAENEHIGKVLLQVMIGAGEVPDNAAGLVDE